MAGESHTATQEVSLAYDAVVATYVNAEHESKRDDALDFLVERWADGNSDAVIATLHSIEKIDEMTAFYTALSLYLHRLYELEDTATLKPLEDLIQRIMLNARAEDRQELEHAIAGIKDEFESIRFVFQSIVSGNVEDAVATIELLPDGNYKEQLKTKVCLNLHTRAIKAAQTHNTSSVKYVLNLLEQIDIHWYKETLNSIEKSRPDISYDDLEQA